MPLTFALRPRHRMQCFCHGGKEILVVSTSAGIRVYSGICPHLMGPLCEGKIVGDTITCPWHGYRFDLITGRCLTIPGWGFRDEDRILTSPAPLSLRPLTFTLEGEKIILDEEP